jgi:hypothetical protein
MTRSLKNFLEPYPQFANYGNGSTWPHRILTTHNLRGQTIIPDYLVVDFDVRPHESVLANRDRFETKVDWDAAVDKTLQQVRTVFAACGFSGVKAGVEGICDDGTMACVLVLPKPNRGALNKVHTRLENKARAALGTMADTKTWSATAGMLMPRIELDTRDRANKKLVPMVAEKFYISIVKPGLPLKGFVTFESWPTLANTMLQAGH